MTRSDLRRLLRLAFAWSKASRTHVKRSEAQRGRKRKAKAQPQPGAAE